MNIGNIGIIGTGNMGSVLIEAFIESHAAAPSSLLITNRTKAKAESFAEAYPDIQVIDNPKELVHQADIIFICVKPLDIYPLLKELDEDLDKTKCLVSITSPVSVEQIESVVNCNVARAIPSITNRALSGISLLSFGSKCNDQFVTKIETLLGQISKPISIEENVTRVASDIVSCGPAFFSYLLQRFIKAAVTETEISEEQATALASGMIIGMGQLLEKGIYTLPTLQEKVCVKGGITGEGIKVLESEFGDVFEHLIQSTHEKYREDIELIKDQFLPTK